MSSQLARQIVDCARPYRWRLLGLLGQVFVLSGLEILKPWPLKLVIDNAISGMPLLLPQWLPLGTEISAWPPLALAAAACIGLLLIHLATAVLTIFYNWMAIGLGQRMVNDLRMQVYAHLQRLSLAFHSRQKVGDLMMRVTADTFAVQTIIMNSVLPILQAALLLCGMVVILASINPLLTVISLSVVPVMAALMCLFNRRIDAVAVAARDADSHVYSLVNWGIAAIKHIQAFTKEDYEHRRFMQASGTALHSHRLLYAWQGVYAQGVNVLIATGMGLVIFVGAREVLQGRLSLGQLLVFTAYVTQLYAPINQITQSFALIAGSRVGARRCFEILASEERLEDGARVFAVEGAKGRVEWRTVSFRYRRDVPVLRGVNVLVEPGQTVALVGATGAGKSTVLSLLVRFFDPNEGQVLLDGVDVRGYQLKSLRSQIAMVLQPPLVFPLTVRENIGYGRADATLEDIQHAARLACIDQLIESLPQGYETIIEEGGTTLSEGEKQRLSIARALLRNAPILIFDEPTSALDAKTEAQIMQGLDALSRNRTTFIIAHRLSTVRNADQILVLKDGIITESGSFSELLEKNCLFASLYQAQFGGPGSTHARH